MKKYKICVLMSTYNPTDYLLDQVKSILEQMECDIDIYIRDDGSVNLANLKKIEKYCKHIYYEENVGVSKSIHKLCKSVLDKNINYDYYAFADQDDFWINEKMKVACKILEKYPNDKPNLYYSNLKVVDENLQGNRKLFKAGIVNNTKGQLLAQIFTFGCTCVFNMECLRMFSEVDIGKLPFDNVIVLLAKFFGNTYYDDHTYILYRQHGNNVSGEKVFGIKKIVFRIKQIPKIFVSEPIFYNLCDFLKKNFYHDLCEYDKKLVEAVLDYKKGFISRIRLLFHRDIKAGYMPKDLYRWIRIIISKY